MIRRPPRSTLFPTRRSSDLSRSAPPRPFSLDDVLHLRDVRDPEISPDGAWVAYTVSTSDTAEDRNKSAVWMTRSEEHTSELQSPCNLVCRLLLEKKKKTAYL